MALQFMHPLSTAVLFFSAGILITRLLPPSSTALPLIYASGAISLFSALFFIFRRRRVLVNLYPLLYTCSLFTAAFAAGTHTYRTASSASRLNISRHAPKDVPVAVAGSIESINRSAERTTLQINALRLYSKSQSISVKSRLLIHFNVPVDPFESGDHIAVSGRVLDSPIRRNPADFDYHSYLQQRRIHAVMYGEHIVYLSSPSRPKGIFLSRIHRIRDYIRRQIQRYTISDDAETVLTALLLGEQSYLSRATVDSFRQSGLSHLLAVSGLHIMCVGLVLYRLLPSVCFRLRIGKRTTEVIRFVLVIGLLATYSLVTGLKPSVVRAGLMASCLIAAPLIQRPVSIMNTLSLAAFCQLVANPFYLYNAGFQLSFSAVSGILLLYPKMTSLLPESQRKSGWVSYISSSLAVTTAAFLGTLPIALFHFGSASYGGLILNLAAIPVTTVLLFAGLLMLLSASLSPVVAALFGYSSDFLCRALLHIATSGASLFSFARLDVSPELRVPITISISLILLLWLLQRARWGLIICSATLLLLSPSILSGGSAYGPTLSVLFFDVGHGDAALLRMPGGRHMLIDTGNAPRSPESNALLRHLRTYGVDCVDDIFLTHPHRDHTGGLERLLESHCTGNVYTDTMLMAGTTLNPDRHVRIRVLSPTSRLMNHQNINERSIVLRIEYGDTCFLFLGDAEVHVEQSLVTHFASFLSCPVIKVAHHGSSTSSSEALVAAITQKGERVQYAVISSGWKRLYGLPDDEIVARWKDTGARVHLTAQEGALWLYSDGKKLYRKTW